MNVNYICSQRLIDDRINTEVYIRLPCLQKNGIIFQNEIYVKMTAVDKNNTLLKYVTCTGNENSLA